MSKFREMTNGLLNSWNHLRDSFIRLNDPPPIIVPLSDDILYQQAPTSERVVLLAARIDQLESRCKAQLGMLVDLGRLGCLCCWALSVVGLSMDAVLRRSCELFAWSLLFRYLLTTICASSFFGVICLLLLRWSSKRDERSVWRAAMFVGLVLANMSLFSIGVVAIPVGLGTHVCHLSR